MLPSAAAATLVVLANTLPDLHLRHRLGIAVRGVMLLLGRIISEIVFAWLGILLIHQSLADLDGLAQTTGAFFTGLATSSLLRSKAIDVAGIQAGLGPLYERLTGLFDHHLRDISAESQSREIRRFTGAFAEHGVSLEDTLRPRLLDHIAHNTSLQESEKWERTDTINGTLGDHASTTEEKTRTIVGHALRWGMHRTLREIMVEVRGTFWRRLRDRLRRPP